MSEPRDIQFDSQTQDTLFCRRFPYRTLITEPIGSLDGIVRVPTPIILGHVTERRVDTSLGGNRVTAGRKELGDAGCFETSFGKSHGGAKTGTSGTHYDGIVRVIYYSVIARQVGTRSRAEGAKTATGTAGAYNGEALGETASAVREHCRFNSIQFNALQKVEEEGTCRLYVCNKEFRYR